MKACVGILCCPFQTIRFILILACKHDLREGRETKNNAFSIYISFKTNTQNNSLTLNLMATQCTLLTYSMYLRHIISKCQDLSELNSNCAQIL